MLRGIFCGNGSSFSLCCYHFAKSCVSARYVRSLANSRRAARGIRYIEGKVKNNGLGFTKVEDELAGVRSIKGLNRVTQNILYDAQEEERAVNFENMYDDVIENADMHHDLIEGEKKLLRSRGWKQAVIRKHFKPQVETNLLTYKAKSQIRYLHNLNSHEWTPERLLQYFPVATLHSMKRLLKAPPMFTEGATKRHDAKVEEMWKLLESGESEEISPLTWELYEEGKITKENYNGTPLLPLPPEKIDNRPKVLGEYMSIIKPYLDAKKKSKDNSEGDNKNNALTTNPSNSALTTNEYQEKDITKSTLPKLRYKFPSESELEDPEAASFLATTRSDEHEADLPCSEFEENLRQEFAEKKRKSVADKIYEDWLNNNKSVETLQTQGNSLLLSAPESKEFKVIEKFNAVNRRSKVHGPDLSENCSSSYVPARDPLNVKIDVPKHLQKPGSMFKVGQCFYDEDGNFLYKLCT